MGTFRASAALQGDSKPLEDTIEEGEKLAKASIDKVQSWADKTWSEFEQKNAEVETKRKDTETKVNETVTQSKSKLANVELQTQYTLKQVTSEIYRAGRMIYRWVDSSLGFSQNAYGRMVNAGLMQLANLYTQLIFTATVYGSNPYTAWLVPILVAEAMATSTMQMQQAAQGEAIRINLNSTGEIITGDDF